MSAIRRVGELHIARARARALEVFTAASAVIPEEWKPLVVEQTTMSLLEFGYHARRVNDICGFADETFPAVDRYLVHFSVPPLETPVTEYKFALNYLHHVTKLTFGFAHADHRKVFLASNANLQATYVTVTSDRYPTAILSLYGIVDCFLSGTIPMIKAKFTDWMF